MTVGPEYWIKVPEGWKLAEEDQERKTEQNSAEKVQKQNSSRQMICQCRKL